MKFPYSKLILSICCIGFISIYCLSRTNKYAEFLKLNQAAMAYFDDYESSFRGYYSDTDLDGDGIDEAPNALAYNVSGKCPKSDSECIWACPAENCNALYSARRNGNATDMAGTCFCGYRIR